MFEFTTLTVFNKVVVAQNPSSVTPETNVILGGNSNKPEVRIGNTRFDANNVTCIEVKNHTKQSLASVSFKIQDLFDVVQADSQDTKEGNYRIVLYIGLSAGSQESFYANDLVYKGKPIYLEFPVNANDSAEAVASRIKTIADKYLLFVAQDRFLSVSVSSDVVTIKGVNGYQQIKTAKIQKYNPNAHQIDCCNTNGDYVDLIKGVPLIWTTDSNGEILTQDKTFDEEGVRPLSSNKDEVGIKPGIEAFGDYDWIIHNLRLPTLTNTYFWSANKSEMPVVGGEYTQFIITMEKKRLGIGGEVVGHQAVSVTTHVLYVLDDGNPIGNVYKMNQVFANLGITTQTTADTELAAPYVSAPIAPPASPVIPDTSDPDNPNP